MATILISGAASGFGALTARALADAGHTVYAVGALDLPDLDVLVHNAGHMVTGPAEACTPARYTALYDTTVLVNAVADRVRAEFLRRIGLADLLPPAA